MFSHRKGISVACCHSLRFLIVNLKKKKQQLAAVRLQSQKSLFGLFGLTLSFPSPLVNLFQIEL